MLCFEKFPVTNKFMDEKGGVSKISVEKFLSQSAEYFRRGTLECFISFGYRKILGITEGA